MTVFTVRATRTPGNQFSSRQMRSWIAEFLRQPHPLPADPGPGEDRISLNLPKESVRELAEFLDCPSSSALRRLALYSVGAPPAFLPSDFCDYAAADDQNAILGIIASVIALVCLAVFLFVIYRKGKLAKESTTQRHPLFHQAIVTSCRDSRVAEGAPKLNQINSLLA
jgi:hypothetical protein